MKILKTFFSSFRNAVLSVGCAILVLAIVGTGLALAAQAGEQKAQIDRNAALQYALDDAGLELSEITITKQKLDREPGNEYYEIAFYTDSYAYEYEINASTGAVLGVDIEALFGTPAMTGGSAEQAGGRQPGADSQGAGEAQQPGSEGAAGSQQAGADSQGAGEARQPGSEGAAGSQQAGADSQGAGEDRQPGSEDAAGGQQAGSQGAQGQQNQSQQSGQEAQESQPPAQETPQPSGISLFQAKEIALKDAGLTSAEVTFTKEKQGLEDGIPVYDLEFITSTSEYEYEIDAATGIVVDKSMEALKDNGTSSAAGNSGSAGADIGLDRAKEIAVADAGLQLSDVTFTKAKQDYDDGVSIYELEFYTASAEYEYEINAATGGIMDSEAKWFQSTASDGAGSSLSYIGVDRAKEIALGHAGCFASEVVFTKAKLEKDDGCTLYEIEFYQGSGEYEYSIEAYTGSVLDWEYDCDSSCYDSHHSDHHH